MKQFKSFKLTIDWIIWLGLSSPFIVTRKVTMIHTGFHGELRVPPVYLVTLEMCDWKQSEFPRVSLSVWAKQETHLLPNTVLPNRFCTLATLVIFFPLGPSKT